MPGKKKKVAKVFEDWAGDDRMTMTEPNMLQYYDPARITNPSKQVYSVRKFEWNTGEAKQELRYKLHLRLHLRLHLHLHLHLHVHLHLHLHPHLHLHQVQAGVQDEEYIPNGKYWRALHSNHDY